MVFMEVASSKSFLHSYISYTHESQRADFKSVPSVKLQLRCEYSEGHLVQIKCSSANQLSLL